MKSVRAAVVQAAPVAFDIGQTLQKVETLAAKAAADGAELILFPEAFITAYPRGLDFGARIGNRSDAGREIFRRYWESSIDVPGAEVTTLGEIAAKHGVHLVIGAIERDGGTLYCTVLFFSSNGTLLGQTSKANANRQREARVGFW